MKLYITFIEIPIVLKLNPYCILLYVSFDSIYLLLLYFLLLLIASSVCLILSINSWFIDSKLFNKVSASCLFSASNSLSPSALRSVNRFSILSAKTYAGLTPTKTPYRLILLTFFILIFFLWKISSIKSSKKSSASSHKSLISFQKSSKISGKSFFPFFTTFFKKLQKLASQVREGQTKSYADDFQRVVNLIERIEKRNEKATKTDIMQNTGWKSKEAGEILTELYERGLIGYYEEIRGNGRKYYYYTVNRNKGTWIKND